MCTHVGTHTQKYIQMFYSFSFQSTESPETCSKQSHNRRTADRRWPANINKYRITIEYNLQQLQFAKYSKARHSLLIELGPPVSSQSTSPHCVYVSERPSFRLGYVTRVLEPSARQIRPIMVTMSSPCIAHTTYIQSGWANRFF